MAKIFISYRREDAAGHARHLYSELAELYGENNVFMDVVTLEGGGTWAERIDEEVGRCDVLLALIGKRWLDIRSADGTRRLDQTVDYVRHEVASGLGRSDTLVIPVLLDGAEMPSREQLPPQIGQLPQRNAVELTTARWDYDFGRLRKLLPGSPRRRLIGAVSGLLAALLLVAGYFFLRPAPPRMEGIFNVAVLDFTQRTTGEGPAEDFAAGRWLADQVFASLDAAQQEFAATSELRGQVEVGRFTEKPRGESASEIEDSLSAIATRLNATLIVYGTFDLTEPPYRFAPTLYLTQDFNGSEELTGETSLGQPIRVSLPLNETPDGQRNRLELVELLGSRLEVLHFFTRGLAYLQADQPAGALELFERASAVDGWDDGRDLLHLFRGASLALLGRTREARDAFASADKAHGGDYDRALMAMGHLFRQKGSLARAEDLFRRTLDARPSKPLERIGDKARINLGLTLALQALGMATPCDASEAHDNLAAVISSYKATPGSEVLRGLAYKAYYQRGLLAQQCGDWHGAERQPAQAAYRQSLPFLQAAVELAEPRAIEGHRGLLEDRQWQRDRWLAWRMLGASQLRLAELGEIDLRADAIASLEQVTNRFERSPEDVSEAVARGAYRLLGQALEHTDPAAAAIALEAADAIGSESSGAEQAGT